MAIEAARAQYAFTTTAKAAYGAAPAPASLGSNGPIPRAGARTSDRQRHASTQAEELQSPMGKPLWHPTVEWRESKAAAEAVAAGTAPPPQHRATKPPPPPDDEFTTPTAGVVTGGRDSHVTDSLNWRDATAVRADPTQGYSGAVDPMERLRRAHLQTQSASISGGRNPILDGEVRTWKPTLVLSSMQVAQRNQTDPFSVLPVDEATAKAAAAAIGTGGGSAGKRGPGATRGLDTATALALQWKGEPSDPEPQRTGRKTGFVEHYREDADRPPPVGVVCLLCRPDQPSDLCIVPCLMLI